MHHDLRAQKNGRQSGARFYLLRCLRPQASADHIHQVAAIAQGNGQQFGKIRQHHRVATDLGTEDDVFQHLCDRADAVVGHGLQNVERGLGVDEQGGRDQVDSGEGHVSIHR